MTWHTHLAQSDNGSRVVSGVALYPPVLALQFQRQLEDFANSEPALALWGRHLRWQRALPVALHRDLFTLGPRMLLLALSVVGQVLELGSWYIGAHLDDGSASLVLACLPQLLVPLGDLVDVHIWGARGRWRLWLASVIGLVRLSGSLASFPGASGDPRLVRLVGVLA